MKEIPAAEAKAHLAELLRAVEQGESFSITRDGKSVAKLVPAAEPSAADGAEARRQAIERFRAERATWPKVHVTVEEILAWRHEGHKY